MSGQYTGIEVIDLCSSDEESNHEEEAQRSGVSQDRMESSHVSHASAAAATAASINNEDSSSIMSSRKRAAEIDLTGDCSNDQHDDGHDNSSIHPDNAKMPRQKKFRGGGQGVSRNTQNDMQENAVVVSSPSSPSSPSNSPTAGSASVPLSSIRIVLEKDGRVKDTGVLHEGMMDLLYQLNQTSMPVPAKLCTRHAVLSASVTNPYSSKSKRSRSPSTVRWIQQHENWSCGYRSLQMVLTALLPTLPSNHAYYQVVPRRSSHVAIPSLAQVQSTLEQAWREGYDPNGARHFQRRILGKTGKPGELGAMEISSVMTYWGLDSAVVQFITCHQSRRLLPIFVKSYFAKSLGKEDCPCCCGGGRHGSMESADNHGATSPSSSVAGTLDSAAMANKLLQFAEASLSIEETCDCPVLPLYLQWEGHAVTIVGFHEQNGRLLVFDPRKKVPAVGGSSHQETTKPSKHLWSTFQLDPEYLRNRDTQVIIASYQSLSPTTKESRREHMKVVTAAEEDVLRTVAASQS
mmetsp:Transcript_8415/g.20251  ORF Transcript_8415/g.20251 Transcript_8415/m.20251 type:complete len:519 (+) Transcript_8415:111-1667(+)